MPEDTSLNIIVKLQDDASAGIAALTSEVSDSAATMAESFAGSSVAAQESYDELTAAMAIDSTEISDSAIAVGLSFDEMTAQIAADSAAATSATSEMDSSTAS